MGITFDNLPEDGSDPFQTPAFILKGQSSAFQSGLILVESDKYSPQCFEVYDGHFKLFLNLDHGLNRIKVKHIDGCIGTDGYPNYDHAGAKVYDQTQITLTYAPIEDNNLVPQVHFIIMVAKDSPRLFDCPKDKMFEGNDIKTAIKKLRVGGRMMQGFMLDEMRKNGFNERCFRFVEERTTATSSSQLEAEGKQRDEIKVDVLEVDKTVDEIRDAQYAQQNPNAQDEGIGWYKFAEAKLKEYFKHSQIKVPIAAVLILDAHWDKGQNLILGHCAFGGGEAGVKYCVFGSHSLHSWPVYWEGIQKALTDTTKLNTDEVANDSEQSCSYWECLNFSLCKFLCAIGCSFNNLDGDSPMNVSRKFLPEERQCLRTGKDKWGPIRESDESGWCITSLYLFLYHPGFALPSDFNDFQFKPEEFRVNQGMLLPSGVDSGPIFTTINYNKLLVTSDTGIYFIECCDGEKCVLHYEYLPKRYSQKTDPLKIGPQKRVELNYEIIQSQLAPGLRAKPLEIKVFAMGMTFRYHIKDLQQFLGEHSVRIPGYSGNQVMKSGPLGGDYGDVIKKHFPPDKRITMIRTYTGSYVHGMQVLFHDGCRIDFGRTTGRKSDFVLDSDDYVIGMNLNCGGYIDGIEIVTNKATSPHFGGDGGVFRKLRVPKGQRVLGLYGKTEAGKWLNQLGIFYGPL